MYKVIKEFTDIQDGGHHYNVGDAFPREGVKVDEGRIAKLASDKNRQKTPLIAETKSLNLATSSAQTTSPKESEQGAVPQIKKEEKPKANNNGRKKKEN